MNTGTGSDIIFVCQNGPLELQGALLAASLRQNLSGLRRLLAAVPGPSSRWGELGAATLAVLRSLDVEICPIVNPIADNYPIGNKVACLNVATDAERLMFLDTDILLVRPLSLPPAVESTSPFHQPFAAKPADLPNVTSPLQWRLAYGACGLKTPAARVPTSMYGDLVPPYFNAGLIAIDPTSGFGPVWLDCCRKIDRKWGIRLKRPHLDQIALPVALHQLKLPYACLDERYNFPAHLKPVDERRPPWFVHYHSPEAMRREPAVVSTIRAVCESNGGLAELARNDGRTSPIFEPHRKVVTGWRATQPPDGTSDSAGALPSASISTPEILITGIPRSGTSFLCNLLHRFANCVVLNEPDGVSRPLRKQPIPYGVGTFCRDIRRDILEGRPIRNKLRNGKVTDETMEANDLSEYTPAVESSDFVLGVKNPLGFISRLGALRRAMPAARIVACVRSPLDTIASWKTTFSHLQTADVRGQTHGGLRDPFLSERQRESLRAVAAISNVAWRRAAWWRYQAELLIDSAADVMVLTYARTVTEPTAVVTEILRDFNAGTLKEAIEASTPRAAKRSALDAEDYQAVRALCTEAAVALGVAEDL